MRIPIKRYVPDPEALLSMEHLLGPNAGTGRLLENAFIVARELKRLLEHHEEETKWMAERIKELEQAAKT